MGLVYTLACPLSCDHCCHDQERYGTGTFETSRAAEVVRQARSLGSVERLFITGGEPFLFHREITAVLSEAGSPDLPVRVVTSAYWAHDPEIARSLLLPLARVGVDTLIISADPSHQRFVSLEHVRCAARAALAAGMKVEIASVFWRPGMEMRTRLGLPDSDTIVYKENLVLPVGRARHHRATWRDYGLSESPSRHDGCQRRPGAFEISVYPNGSVYPCCGGGFGLDAGLAIGNVYEEPLADIVSRMRSDPFVRSMREGGPALVYEMCRRHFPELRAWLPDDEGLCTACQICVALNSVPAVKERLRPVIESAGQVLTSVGRLRLRAELRDGDAEGLATKGQA